VKCLLKGAGKALLVIAVLLFFVGGKAISVFTKTDRVTAEMLGIALAFVFGILGVVANNAAGYVDDDGAQ